MKTEIPTWLLWVVVGVVVFFTLPALTMIAWNLALPDLLGAPTATYWNGLGVDLLLSPVAAWAVLNIRVDE